ncbi:MAG: phosphoglucosamine mutase [Planctomycetia bacterium]|nr:phosphoglucosamine mutase [Planctomycetia bacterium]
MSQGQAGQNQLIVSVSGIRGIIGRDLTPEIACRFGAAHGTFLQGGSVVVSRDGRPSGDMLRRAVIAGLQSTGCNVQDIDVAPTPTCGFAVKSLQAAGGIQVTASHNPAEWNGLKLFGATGEVLTAAHGKQVAEMFASGAFQRRGWDQLGKVHDARGAERLHQARVLELVDGARLRQRHFRVFLDANGGSGGVLGSSLLEAFGCTVIGQGCTADGHFLHTPEPTAENLRDVCPLVKQHETAIGFVLDPDADRLALIDERGRYIGEELTLALAVQYRLQQEPGPVVVNMSTSRVVEDIAARANSICHRSAVGEANVVEKMREVGATIGGEGNGGVIDRRVGGVRDPFIGMGLILSLMAETGRPLSELADALPTYHIQKDKYPVPAERLPELFAVLERQFPEAKVNRLDGLRLDWADRWLHVRPSNTEPIVRVIAEAPQAADAMRLCQEVGRLLG